MRTTFAYCLDCHELTTGRTDTSKGFLLDAASNHDPCDVRPFDDLLNLPAPIRNIILRLGASVPMTDNAVTLFRLGLNLHDYPTGALEAECLPVRSSAPAAANTSPTSLAPVLASAASMRSLPVSPPTPTTAADEPALFEMEATA